MTRSQRHMRFIHGYDSCDYPPWWGPENVPPQVPPYEQPPGELLPAPVVNTISPSSAVIGSEPFVCTVNGSEFVEGSIIIEPTLGNITPDSVTATALSFPVDPNQAPAAGDYFMHVRNPDGQESNAVTFTWTEAGGQPQPEPGLTITSIVPDHCAMNDPAFELVLNGTAFTPQCTIEAQGSVLYPTFVSPTQLTLPVDPQTIARPGPIEFFVKNSDGVMSNMMVFTFNDPANPPYPDQGLPGQPYPDQGLPEPQPYPDQGLPEPQPYPDQGLPAPQPYPDQTLPGDLPPETP